MSSLRYILVLYADRGLVKSGDFSNLFNPLYLMTATFYFSWTICLLVVYLVKSEKEHHLCMGTESPNDYTYRDVMDVASLLRVMFIVVLFLMYYKIIRYVRSKSKNGQVPAKFGRYQRNVLTMKQCLIYGLICSLLGLRIPILYFLFIDVELFRTILLVSNLVIQNLISDFIFPIWILINLYYSMPEFYILTSKAKSKIFYVRQPEFLPRDLSQKITKTITNTQEKVSNTPTPKITKLDSIIFVVNEKVEKPTSPIRLNNNFVSKVIEDSDGKKHYIKYMCPIEC